MIRDVLGGVCEESYFINSLSLLNESFNDLNDMGCTLPGHQG